MIRLFSFIAFISLLIYGCDFRNNGQKKVDIKDSTSVLVLDSVYNFGSISEGTEITYSYKFKNTGNCSLVVKSALASCGCTVAEKPENPIPPGQTGAIKVKYDSKNREGDIMKTITVSSNARPEFPILRLEGRVIKN